MKRFIAIPYSSSSIHPYNTLGDISDNIKLESIKLLKNIHSILSTSTTYLNAENSIHSALILSLGNISRNTASDPETIKTIAKSLTDTLRSSSINHSSHSNQHPNPNLKLIINTLKDIIGINRSPISEKYMPANTYNDIYFNCDISLPNPWVSRKNDEGRLQTMLESPENRIIEICHLGGSGKSRFIRNFLKTHEPFLQEHYDQTVWFTFYQYEDRENEIDPFTQLLHDIRYACKEHTTSESDNTQNGVEKILQRHRILLVLDGLEVIQNDDGYLKNQSFSSLLYNVANSKNSQIIITTKSHVANFDAKKNPIQGVRLFELTPWSNTDIEKFLCCNSCRSDDIVFIIDHLGRHPLLLRLFRNYLHNLCDGNLSETRDIVMEMKKDLEKSYSGNESNEQRLNHKVAFILKELLDKMTVTEKHIMTTLNCINGSIEDADIDIIKNELNNITFNATIRKLADQDILTKHNYNQTKIISAHPMIIFGLDSVLSTAEKATSHRELMTIFKYKATTTTDPHRSLHYWIEWAHQLTKLIGNNLPEYISKLKEYPEIRQSQDYHTTTSLLTDKLLNKIAMQARQLSIPHLQNQCQKRSDPSSAYNVTSELSQQQTEKKRHNDLSEYSRWENNLHSIKKQLTSHLQTMQQNIYRETLFYSIYLNTIIDTHTDTVKSPDENHDSSPILWPALEPARQINASITINDSSSKTLLPNSAHIPNSNNMVPDDYNK